MCSKRWVLAAAFWAIAQFACTVAQAGDLKIPLPHKSKLTPVQKLNREGVDAIRAHRYEKAKTLFYKAYLYDPDDPFTLNNLGYVSELEGKLENAQRFYQLAAQRATGAVIDKASTPQMQGKLVSDAVTGARETPMQINRGNVEAVRLLSQRRAPEAETVLQRSLDKNPNNAFTLNNVGVAKEMQGDFEGALKYYNAAAGSQSQEPATVTLDSASRGKPVSVVAAVNARRVRDRLRTEDSTQAKAARMNLRGVTAMNRNDVADARKLFLAAYAADPADAFTLNNMGYLAEMDGDLETAQDFYAEARLAQHANARATVTTRSAAEGRKLAEIADDNDHTVGTQLSSERENKRRQRSPIQLWGRDGKPVDDSGPAPQAKQPDRPH
jgi:Flp pilus assembly protein TadD